ncbi:MAG: hypothetical protein RL679_659 [Bacteroidota bacterium]|jgi:hypothetical protein
MMRVLLVVFVLLPIIGLSQKPIELKSKFLGVYEGKISSFLMDSGKDLLSVDESPITIEIKADAIFFAVGSNKKSGIYTVLFEADKYFLLDCKINGQLANERVVVFKKGKKISRDGLYPQPNTILLKSKN